MSTNLSSSNDNRIYGIDLMRIFSMYMVVLLHVFGHGGILNACEKNSVNYFVSWFFEAAAYCAVNCYALISGYVGVKSKHKYSNIINLTLMVIFYMVVSTTLFYFFVPDTATAKDILGALNPFTTKACWYFAAYFGIFFLMPFMNKLLLSLSKKEAKLLSATIIVVFSIMPYVLDIDVFKTSWGYSTIWLMMLYLLGGCIRLFSDEIPDKKPKYIIIFILCAVLAVFSKYSNILKSTLITYIYPTTLLSAIMLLFIFSKVSVKSTSAKKAIMFFSPLTFGIYVIHTEHYVWHNILSKAFANFASLNVVLLVIYALLAAAIIFLICALIDYLRLLLFKLLRIKKCCELLVEKLRPISNKIAALVLKLLC